MQKLTLTQKQKLANYGLIITILWAIGIVIKNIADFFQRMVATGYADSFTLPNLIVDTVSDLIFPAIVFALILTIKNMLHMLDRGRWLRVHDENRPHIEEALRHRYNDEFRAIKKTPPKISIDLDQFTQLDQTTHATIVVEKKWQDSLAVGDEIEFHLQDDFGQLRYGHVVNVRPEDASLTLVVETSL